MSKNLTRKGLALGAVVALGTSLFAGAPAQAAAGLIVAPSAGTGYTVLSSDSFTVKVFGNTDYTLTGTATLNWKITRPSSAASASYTGSEGDTVTTVDSGATVDVLAQDPDDVEGKTTLQINPSISEAESQEYKVQAFIEKDGEDGLTAGDVVVSNTVTVRFVHNLTSTITVDQVAASQAVTGSVKYSSTDFNYSQTDTANTELFNSNNSNTFDGSEATVTVSSAKDSLEYSFTDNIEADAVIGVRAKSKLYDGADFKYTSSAVYSTAISSAADAYDTTITPSENVLPVDGGIDVRSGTKSFSYRVDFTKADVALAAGKPVVITVTEADSSLTAVSGDVVRVNGKKLTGSAETDDSATLNTVTDAKGGVTVTVESDRASLGDTFTITVASNDQTSTEIVEYVAAGIDELYDANKPLGNVVRTVSYNGSTSINYELRDQFGKLWTKTGTNYRLAMTTNASNGDVSLPTSVLFSGGKATAKIDDSSEAADTYTVTATLQSSTGSGYTADASEQDVVSSFNVVEKASVVTKLTLNAATQSGSDVSSADSATLSDVTRSDAVLAALDIRTNSNADNTGNTVDGALVSGTLAQANGSNAPGATVTISGAGVFFSDDATGASYLSAGTITVTANADGQFQAYVHSNKAGKVTLTFASAGVSKTQVLKFASVASDKGAAITITAPDSSVAGRAVDVSVLLTDKYGSPVQTKTAEVARISVSVTGPGSNTAIAADTDASGLISFKLIFGANDSGTAVVKVTYDSDDSGAKEAITATKSILVGAAAVPSSTAAIAGSTGKFFVSATAAAGKSVVVKVAGKFVTSFKATGSKKSVAVKATKGKKKVTVFVGGKLVATKTVTVK